MGLDAAAGPALARYQAQGTYAERTELERRRLYVAMTGARDGLWMGYLT